MIKTQAAKLVTGLANKKIIEEKSHDVYTYGFELIISGLVNVFFIAAVSIAFRRYYDWLLFLLAFIPLRTTAGGYHASSHMRCILCGSAAFFVCMMISQLQIDWTFAILAIAVLSFLLILLFSPVEAKNKKLKETVRKKNRTVSIWIGSVNLMIALSTIFVAGLPDILNIYFAGVFAAAISMLVVRITASLKKSANATH